MIRILFLLVYFLIPSPAKADDLQALRMELLAVQARMEVERLRYKSEIERADLVARYLLPELKAREAALGKQIAEAEKKAAEKKPDEKN